MADNLDKLYGAVSAKFDIGDAEAFKAKMQTPEDRKKFYDVVSGKGFDLGDYNSYETRLGTTTSVQKKNPVQTGGENSTVVAEQVTQPSKTNGYEWSSGIKTPLSGEAEQATQSHNVNPVTGTKENPYDYIFSNQKKATEHLQTADAAGMDINYILKNEKVKTAQDLYTQIQQAPDAKTKKELTTKYEEFLKQPAAIDNGMDWEGSVNGRKVNTDDPLKGKTVGDAVEMVRAKQEEKNKNIDAYKNTHAETNDVIQKMRTAVGYSPDPDKGYKELDAVHNFFGSAGKTIDGMLTGAQYMLADEAGRKQILKQKMMDQELYPEQAKDDNLTHISGMVGGIIPYVGLGAAGGVVGTPGVFLANSLGMGLTGYSNAAQEAYAEKFKETGNEDEAFKTAETMSRIGAGVGAAQGAALSLMPGGKLPTSVRDFIFKTGQKNAVLGGMFSGSRFLENKLAQMEGLDRESMSGVKESFVDGMLLGTVMDGLHYFPGKIGDATKGRFENILARYSFADVTQAVDNAVQAGVMDNASAQKVMAPIQEKAAAFSKMPDTMPFEKQETVLPLMVERNRLAAEKEKTAEAFHGGIDAKIEDIDRRIAEQSGSPLTSKERMDFEKLQKRKGDPEDKLTSSESDLHDHYAAREKSNFAVNNIDETPQRVTYKDGRTGLLHKNSEGDIEFTPDGNSKAVVFDKGGSVNEKSIKQLGFTVESKNELARPDSQIVSGEVKVGGEVVYKGKRYSITENKNAPEGFKTDADGNVRLLYLKDENGQRIVVGADNADGVSLIADANKLIGRQETKPEVSLQEPVESKLKEETAPAAEEVVAAKDGNVEVVKEEVKPVVEKETPVENVWEGVNEKGGGDGDVKNALKNIELGLTDNQHILLAAEGDPIATVGNVAKIGVGNDTKIKLTPEEQQEVNRQFKAHNKNLTNSKEFNEWRKDFSKRVLQRVKDELNGGSKQSIKEQPKADSQNVAAEPKPKTGKQLKEEHKVFKEQILAAEPTTPRQFIMQWFAGGGKMKTAEFKKETGFTKGEDFRKRIWAHTNKNYFMRDRAGMRVGKEVKPYSLDDIISMVQNEWKDNHGGELDYLDVKNEVIDVLRSHESPSGMIENLREDFSDREGNIIADKYDRAAMRNEEAQEAMGVFENADKHAEDEKALAAVEKVDELELDEKDISSIEKFVAKFTDASGKTDWAKAAEAVEDVFNEAYGELTKNAAKQIEKIIADGKAKNEPGRKGENLPEDTGNKGDNGGQDKAERKAEQERLATAKEAHAKAEKEYNALNKALTDDLKAKQVGMFEGKEQKMFDDAGDMKQRVEDAKRKLDEAKAELDKAQDVVDANINGQKKLFGKDKVADGLNDLDNIVNENRIAEEYNDVREDAKNEYEKELDRHLEDLREAYSSASRTEAGLRKLQEKTPSRIGGFVKRLLTGTTPEDVVASKARLAEMQKQYRKDKADLRALLPRERGSNFVVEKLSRAARTGEISQETADLAIDLIKKNPDIFEDLAISITKKPSGNEGLQGWYRAADALVKVFKNPSDPTTAVHEVLHHTERFLPHDIRDNIIKEWNKEVELQKDSLAKKLKNEKDVSKRQEITTGLLYLELAQARQAEPNYSNVVAMERIMSKYLGDHTDSQGNFHKGLGDSWYQLFNPSEWWAVNASRLFREAKNKPELKTWTDKAKAFYNYLIQSAKRIFKGSPTEAVEKGLKAVLDGQTLEDRQGSQLSTSKKLIGNSQNDAGLNQLIIPEKKPKVIDALARIGKGLIEAKEAKIDDVIEKIKAYVLSKSRNITEEDVEELKGEILDKINIETISEEPLNAKNIDKAVAKKLKEETREAGRDLIRKRRASIDSENLKTELYAQSLEKQTTKEQREVLPFILEKTNVPEKLGRPDLVETLKNDKAKLEPIAAQIREHFDKMWEKIVANTENLDADQIKDYVTHIWDIPKDKTEQVANWFSTKNRFLNKRYISTIEEGVDLFGLKPKVLDIAQIIRIHDSVANTVIANGEFVTDLKTMSRDGMPLIIRADKSPEGWVTVDHPAMSSPLVIPGENGKANVVIKLPYKVHPDLAEPVKAIFGKKIDSKFLDNYMKVDGVMKKIGLSVSLFHHGALSETAIALMGPVKAVTAIGKLGKAAIVNKFEGTPLAQFPNEAVDAIKHGVKFGHTLDINTGAVNGILEKIASKTKDIPVAGKAAELLSSFNEKWDTGLWNYLHDGLKLYAFMDAKTKMPENTANPKKYLQEHAQLINDYFGGQNWDVLLTSPRAQQIMRLALLSPDWTISKLRLAGAPVGLGAMSKDAKYVRAKASGMFWVKAAIYYGVGLNLMNAYFRKQDRKEHPEYYPEGNNSFMDNTMFGNTVGHKTHLFTGRYEDGSEMYRRWGKEFRELPELFMNEDGVSFPKPLLEKAGGKMAPAAQIVSKLMTGNSLGGYEDWDLKDKKGWAWTAGAMKVIAKGYTPMSTGNFFRDDKEWKPADLMFPGGKGMTKSKTIDLFKKGIDQGDEAYVKEIYSGAVRNNLDAYGLFKTAIQSSNAEKTKELMQGIKTVDDVKQKIRGTTDKEEKQKLFRKLRKFEIENKQKHQANKLWKEAEKELRD